VTAFANSGVIITDSLMIILGADILMAGWLAMLAKVDACKHLQAQTQVELDALLPSVFLYQDRRRPRLKERNGYGWQIHPA